MAKGNPYAPPESFDSPTAAGRPTGFRVEGDLLVLQDGAKLPELCIGSGATQGELSRYERPIHWIPAQTHLLFFPLMLVALPLGSPVFSLLVLIGWCFLLNRFQRKITVGFSIKKSFLKKQMLILAGMFLVWLGALIPIISLPLSFEIRVMMAYVLFVDGAELATFLAKGLRIKDIKDGVARLVNVNPVTLAKLSQWNEHNNDGIR